MAARITNAFTCDVEDYFQVSALAPHFPREQWDSVPCRVERNVDRILALLDGHGARGLPDGTLRVRLTFDHRLLDGHRAWVGR